MPRVMRRPGGILVAVRWQRGGAAVVTRRHFETPGCCTFITGAFLKRHFIRTDTDVDTMEFRIARYR